MVSLFTTATTSSATPNDTRRAYNMAESGVRYAFSELLNSDSTTTIIQTIAADGKTFTVDQAGSYTLDFFSPWFNQSSKVENQITLDVDPRTEIIPPDLSLLPNTLIVNLNFNPNSPVTGESALISGIANQNATTLVLNLDLGDDFEARIDEEEICFAVQPSNDPPYPKTLNQGGSIYVSLAAQNIFPKRNGIVNIANAALGNERFNYFYTKRIDEPANNRVKLINLKRPPSSGGFPLEIATSTYIILPPMNIFVLSQGQSGNAVYGGEMDFAVNFAWNAYHYARFDEWSPFDPEVSKPPDISEGKITDDSSELETDSTIIDIDTVTDSLDIGGGHIARSRC